MVRLRSAANVPTKALRWRTRANRRLIGTSIAGVAEEASGVVLSDGGERWAESGVEGILRARCGLAQDALHLGPGGFDRVEVGRVARKVEIGEAGAVEERAHGPGFVGGEIVHDQHGIGPGAAQLRQQNLLQVGMARPMVHGCTRTPVSSASRSRYSRRVRWFSALTRSLSAASASSLITGPDAPRIGFASSRPSAWAVSIHRYTLERPTTEPARNLIPRLATFQRRHHHAPAQIA
jgi:hypothetical protein